MNADDVNRPEPHELADEANFHAARSTMAWLTGRGLAAEIGRLHAPDDGDLIPTPGLEDLLDDLGDSCLDACNAADTVFTLLDDDMEADVVAAAVSAVATCEAHADRSEHAMRRIAEVLLGVSTRSAPSDTVARAERAAVVTLVSHPGAADVVDDGVSLGARTYEELVTELAGTLCRMIIDHDAVLRLARTDDTSRRALVFAVNGVGDLDLLLIDPALPHDGSGDDEARLVEMGWTRSGAGLSAHWDDPLVVMEPATLTVETLRDAWGLTEPLALTAFAEHQGPDSWER